jgi:exopolyphosphatase/guanosine-5'-triphosphate,3'-diphosphate pyrophosphatase
MIAQALSSSFGQDKLPGGFATLCTGRQLESASQWGLALRLAHRLSGGVSSVLKRSKLSVEGELLCLTIRAKEKALISEGVERRLSRLAEAIGRSPKITTR